MTRNEILRAEDLVPIFVCLVFKGFGQVLQKHELLLRSIQELTRSTQLKYYHLNKIFTP